MDPEAKTRAIARISAFVLIPLVAFVMYKFRRYKYRWMQSFDFEPLVADKLQTFGVTLVKLDAMSSRGTQTNPFGGPATFGDHLANQRMLRRGGEFDVCEHRLARCTDSSGRTFELWVQIDAKPGLTGDRPMRFRSDNPESLPPKIQLILS